MWLQYEAAIASAVQAACHAMSMQGGVGVTHEDPFTIASFAVVNTSAVSGVAFHVDVSCWQGAVFHSVHSWRCISMYIDVYCLLFCLCMTFDMSSLYI